MRNHDECDAVVVPDGRRATDGRIDERKDGRKEGRSAVCVCVWVQVSISVPPSYDFIPPDAYATYMQSTVDAVSCGCMNLRHAVIDTINLPSIVTLSGALDGAEVCRITFVQWAVGLCSSGY